MKKVLAIAVSAGMAVSLAACGSESAAEATASGSLYTPGTYTASSKGHEGDVTVTAEFSDSKITSVTVDASAETASIGGAAQDTLQQEFMDAQSADVDAVSGATETSEAAKRAMQNVIQQASGSAASSADTAALQDGVYTASAPSFGTKGMMQGNVTIENGKITDIAITDESDSQTGQWFQIASEKLIPRIIEAQSLGVDSITGATTSSGAIKSITAQAIDQAGGNSADWYQEPAKSTDVKTLDGYDVIVVGLGGSGILSYCAAADAGASVFGIEAAGEIGGNSISTYGPMAVNSKNLNAEYNDGKDNIDADDLYQTWMDYVGTDKKADVIHEAVYDDGAVMDYYMDQFGFSFDGKVMGKSGYLGSFVRPDWDKEWIVYTADDNNTKWYDLGPDKLWQFKNALNKAKGMNEKNDYQLELTADSLLFDEDGNVNGVHAVSYDGTQYEIHGKTVILATGGFLGNDDMMKEVFGSTIHSIGDTVNKGTGIQMGQSAGGTTYALDTLPMTHMSQIPNLIRDDSLTADEKTVLTSLALTTDVDEISEDGTLFYDADSGEAPAGVVFAPGFHYYTVYTQDDIDQIKTNGLSETAAAAAPMALTSGGSVEAGKPIDTIDKIMDTAVSTKNAYKGTPAQLAKELGMNEDTLTKSLGDADTTYYLVECAGYSYGTVGGLDVDANMNVLKEDGTPIANLFAVGQDSEGVENVGGKPYTPWAGQAQAWTFVSGKIAGTAAASVASSGN